MSREQLHQDISELLETLTINNNRLSLHEEKLSQLDIDVLRRQCIDLYEAINKLAIEGKKPLQPMRSITEPQEEPAPVEPVAEVGLEAPEEVQEPVVEVEQAPQQEAPVSEVIKDKPSKPVVASEKKTQQDEVRSIHSKLQDEAEMVSLFEKFNSKPIDSIAKAINISRRFEFQNNFFEGDAKAYKAFIEKLDSASDREDAFEIYHEYKNRLHWVHEELKDELKSLMYRKYAN